MHVFASLCVGHVDDPSFQQTEEIDPHLSIGHAVVFLGDHRAVEDCLATNEVELVISEVQQALRLHPREHALSVYTKSNADVRMRHLALTDR